MMVFFDRMGDMNDDIISSLNGVQQQAVVHHGGPLLILAGAGSGKTRALTHRAAWLIREKGIEPENILLLTFTNKAAGEMKERIKRLLTTNSQKTLIRLPLAGTFHSFCAKVLRAEADQLGVSPQYVIYDEHDQIETIKNTMIKLDISPKRVNPNAALNTISQAKNELISPLDYPQFAHGPFQETVARIYIHYQRSLRDQNALDFDDLIFETVHLLEKSSATLQKYQNRFLHILVDEWQDTNHAQYKLVKLLSKATKNLTVVGDASQAIYGWRGADYRNINYLIEDFPDLKVINLEQNYRSTKKILAAANTVIRKNQSHPVLNLWTDNQEGEKIKVFAAGNELDEAAYIINEIQSNNTRPLNDYAVLYRTNAQSRVIEEVFLKFGIPYILVGGVRFYERKEIKDIISYLRLISNSKDLVAYQRIDKIGKTRARNFFNWLDEEKDNFPKLTNLEILDKVLDVTNYLELYDAQDEEDLMRLENIKELRSVAAEFADLTQLLENVALVQQEYFPENEVIVSKNDRKNAVTLMTAHSAKGLEFPIVFMIGMEEGLFPHARALLDPLEIEEERRLAYVAMTRAKERLYVSFASRRFYFGKYSSNQVSRFVNDIPTQLVEMVE